MMENIQNEVEALEEMIAIYEDLEVSNRLVLETLKSRLSDLMDRFY